MQKLNYKKKIRNFTLTTIVIVIFSSAVVLDHYISQIKLEAEVKETSSVNTTSKTAGDKPYNNNNQTSNKINEQADNSFNNTPSVEEPEVEENLPEYYLSLNLDTCIENFKKDNLAQIAGFNELDENTITSTYYALCSELIQQKPNSSYEFVFERSLELPEMPYYVETFGIFLLDNYKVIYQ